MTATKTLVLAGIAASWIPFMSLAQDSKNQGYLVDMYGNSIATSTVTGLCWRSSDWTPSRAVESCDPVALKAEVSAPKAVVAAPAKVATVKAVPRGVSFSADALFAFDKSLLRPEGKALLDDFARQLNNAQYEAISVTGHTDRLGSDDYNQKLSQRRANAVKDYLVGKDMPADRIKARGQGETQPITQAGDCNGTQIVSVITCLQPDRRVHVEVTGTLVLTTNLR